MGGRGRRVMVVFLVGPAPFVAAIVFLLAAVNAATERVFAQIVSMHARRPAVHRVLVSAAWRRFRIVVAVIQVVVVVVVVIVVVVVVAAVVLVLVLVTVVVPARLVTVAVFGRPSGPVSVQRLRAAEQPLLAAVPPTVVVVVIVVAIAVEVVVGGHASVTPVGVTVVVVAVVVLVLVPAFGAPAISFQFFPVLLPIGVRLVAAAAARELAH